MNLGEAPVKSHGRKTDEDYPPTRRSVNKKLSDFEAKFNF